MQTFFSIWRVGWNGRLLAILQTICPWMLPPYHHWDTSISGRMSNRKISKQRYSALDFSNCSKPWHSPRKQRYRDACHISERYVHCNIQSRGFKTSRHLSVTRLTTWLIGAQELLHALQTRRPSIHIHFKWRCCPCAILLLIIDWIISKKFQWQNDANYVGQRTEWRFLKI